MKTPRYHEKKYTLTTSFTHSEAHAKKLAKAAKKQHVNKSQIIRDLIDTL